MDNPNWVTHLLEIVPRVKLTASTSKMFRSKINMMIIEVFCNFFLHQEGVQNLV